jgi:hypothetical protein
VEALTTIEEGMMFSRFAWFVICFSYVWLWLVQVVE